MSKERARRREEREREAAALAAQRAREAEAEARRRARHDRLLGWIPRPAPVQSGTLAARRRQATGLFLCFVFAVNLVVWLASPGWALRAMALLLSLLLGPVVVLLISKN